MSDSDIQAHEFEDVTLDQALTGDIPQHTQRVEPVTDPDPEPVAAAAEPTVETDAPTASDERLVPLKAVQAEREKRQAAEQRLRELEAAQREQTERKVDPLEDPEGFAEQVQRQVALVRFELHEEAMREKHADYDDVQAEFLTMAQSNPALMAEARNARNVPKFAYETVMKARELEKLKDVDTYKSDLRKQIEAEVRAEYERESTKRRAKADELDSATALPSLATVGSGGINDNDVSLDALVGHDANARRRR